MDLARAASAKVATRSILPRSFSLTRPVPTRRPSPSPARAPPSPFDRDHFRCGRQFGRRRRRGGGGGGWCARWRERRGRRMIHARRKEGRKEGTTKSFSIYFKCIYRYTTLARVHPRSRPKTRALIRLYTSTDLHTHARTYTRTRDRGSIPLPRSHSRVAVRVDHAGVTQDSPGSIARRTRSFATRRGISSHESPWAIVFFSSRVSSVLGFFLLFSHTQR